MFDIPLERNLEHPIPYDIADAVKLVVLPDLPSGQKCRGMVCFPSRIDCAAGLCCGCMQPLSSVSGGQKRHSLPCGQYHNCWTATTESTVSLICSFRFCVSVASLLDRAGVFCRLEKCFTAHLHDSAAISGPKRTSHRFIVFVYVDWRAGSFL